MVRDEVLKLRKEWAESDSQRDSGLITPPDITRIDDIKYGPAGWENLMDIYYLTDSKDKKNPVIVSIHGGAYVYGNKEVYQFYCMSLAQRGFTVVNINYRLAPESRFPSCLEDAESAISYIFAHKDEYPVDTDNIFMVGDSAGAHMAALFCCATTNSEYADIINFHPQKEHTPKAVALNCGVYDIEQRIEHDQDNLFAPDLLGENWKENFDRLTNTGRYVTKDFPPTFIMSSSHDFLKYQLPKMKDILSKAGVEVFDKIYGDENTPELTHVFHCNIRLPMAKVCNDEECDFFKRHMGGSV